MVEVVVSPLTKLRKLKGIRKLLEQSCPHVITSLSFVQQSHNATVLRGELAGQAAFFKVYDPLDAAKLTPRSIAEIDVVSMRMKGYAGGVAPLLWASVPHGVVVTGEVPGRAVADMLGQPDAARMLGEVDRWLYAYAGDTTFEDRFSTSYWAKKRATVDLDPLGPQDRAIAADLRALQAMRGARMGTVAALKGQVPRDFAPWNLHWTGDAVWGFDMEGHRVASLAQTIGRFRVLAVEGSPRAVSFDGGRATSRSALDTGTSTADRLAHTADLMSFVYGDMLFERFVKWAGHSAIAPRLKRAIRAHLGEA